MNVQTHSHGDKVKVTFECTRDERAYLKILCAKEQMTLSEFLLSYIRNDFPKKPNKDTIEAIKELEEGGGIRCTSIKNFWEQMGFGPDA